MWQAAVAQSAAPVLGAPDDISPVDRAVANLLYHDPAQRMQTFANSFMQPGAAGKLAPLLPQQPAGSEQASAPGTRRNTEPLRAGVPS